KVNQSGRASSYPPADQGWALEESLDVQVAHAVCQNCKIVLVEANSATLRDVAGAEDTAVSLGANATSNSYGTFGEINSYAKSYNHPGVAIVVASGDSGFSTSWPASFDTVVAVGGTSLQRVQGKGNPKTRTTSYL